MIQLTDEQARLLHEPNLAHVCTLMKDGRPQTSPVWVDYDGECARINTTLERQKGRNLLRNRRVSLLVVDPENTARFIQIRGAAELVTEGAVDHVDVLTRKLAESDRSWPLNTRKYSRHRHYYGGIYPEAQRARETRVICRIHARRITLDAVHV